MTEELILNKPTDLLNNKFFFFEKAKTENKILGVDPSLTGTGLCLLDLDLRKVYTGLLNPKIARGVKAEKQGRIVLYAKLIHGILERERPRWIVLEDYSFGSHSAAYDLGELGGVLRILFQEYIIAQDLPAEGFFVKMAPTAMKKIITGKGNADKKVLMEWLQKKYNLGITDNNIADAAGLAASHLFQIDRDLHDRWLAAEYLKSL